MTVFIPKPSRRQVHLEREERGRKEEEKTLEAKKQKLECKMKWGQILNGNSLKY